MKRTLAVRLLPFALALALGGCGGFNGPNEAYDGPSQTHPIAVSADTQTLSIPVPRTKSALTDEERRAVAAFADAYKERGHGAIAVSTPSGSSNTTSSMNVLVDVRDLLAEKGVALDAISYTPYQAAGADAEAPLILSYKRYVATPRPCGDWSENFAHDPANGVPPNFGCASQNNLAVMVADPADLVMPRNMTPSDAQRRAVVLDKYRKGEITGTQRDNNDSAAVSEVNK
ncbi:MAG TPA: CpaD family pilus assembly protein [Parvibaculum sp.]|uniref:CpaD family pilus assembly protein n=1 Tax=Parvibaculum sp. TaxID=2024848 RepID=UPI002CCEAA3B|nr:CpaD family pilus assembly protein [Parvibaculum sp.]HMM15522.1 CpaD family pilus assembly protein [Parvibaculum sp.]